MKGYLYWSAYNNVCETLHMDAAPGRVMNGDATSCGNALAMASRDGRATPELFVAAARQFLASADARTCTVTCDGYEEYELGFETRRHGDYLYVTRACGDERLAPGMRIAAVGRNAVPFVLKNTGAEIFWGRGTDREDWDLALRMYDDIDVFPGDGHVERLSLRRFPQVEAQRSAKGTGGSGSRDPGVGSAAGPCAGVREVATGVALLEVRSLADAAALERTLVEAAGLLARCERLVLDVRRCAGEADPASYLALLPYLTDVPRAARDVFPDVPVYTIYSQHNAERLLAPLGAAHARFEIAGDDASLRLLDEVAADVRAKAAQVLAAKRALRTLPERRAISELPEVMPSPFGDERVEPAAVVVDAARPSHSAPRRVAVLVDSMTGVGAERLAQACMGWENVRLVGRATPGAVDYANYVTADYPDIRARLTYPISRTEASRDGHGFARCGLPLDVHVPFSPEECTSDVMLARAVEALG